MIAAQAEEEDEMLIAAMQVAPAEHTMPNTIARKVWFVLLLVCMIEAIDLAFLSALFHSFEVDLALTPSMLGYLALAQSVAMKGTVLLWGPYVDRAGDPARFLRILLIGIGCSSLLTGVAQSFYELALARFCTGALAGIISPLSGCIIAEGHERKQRGKLFGVFNTVRSAGRILGTGVGAALSTRWRLLLAVHGSCCILAGLIVYKLLPNESDRLWQQHVETVSQTEQPKKNNSAPSLEVKTERSAVRKILSLRSFQLIVIHGVFGSFPFSGFSFIVLWFQTGGVPLASAGMYANALHFGSVLGHFVAGYIGDWAAQKHPDHGRIYLAQVADMMRIPMAWLIFVGATSASMNTAAASLFVLGLIIPLVPTGAIMPMLSDLLPQGASGTIMGYHLALESVFGVMAAPLVGTIAEKTYGYHLQDVASACDGCVDEQNHW
eukprot:CAMPEP_0171492534 /NCGR_PEP_ID=MMETSP0958-20121227/4464_1 /TAXON_ID=87120 /ORGANISM="Aurantiochytrium limacinum, Strain ATCCMYA-1381" /LENGTH=436 /DNA_ID=CAMNT_0012026065 /DNA_START=467 /DNA_END=1774 /DNA_ORIENTATION=-